MLDDSGKYFAGCAAACMIPVAIVTIQTFRDFVVETAASKGKTTGILYDALASVLFALQMCFAYWLMLLTMLYEPAIFSCIMLGFMVAFFVLRRVKRQKQSESLDKSSVVGAPCCSSTEDAKA